MLILGFESSAKTASVALCAGQTLVAQYFQNSGHTHSRTLLPMAEQLLESVGVKISELDLIAVSHGPGSFTGVRIGVSTVKGLAWAAGKPVCGVSTLEAMAWNGLSAPEGSVICCAMDARREQVYNALFEIKNAKPVRLCADRALGLNELCKELSALSSGHDDLTPWPGTDHTANFSSFQEKTTKACKKRIFIVGDGANLCYNIFNKNGIDALLAPEPLRYQSAWGVCMAAAGAPAISADKLLPVYLRLSQAERERQARAEK